MTLKPVLFWFAAGCAVGNIAVYAAGASVVNLGVGLADALGAAFVLWWFA